MDLDESLTNAIKPVVASSGCTVERLERQLNSWWRKGLMTLIANGEITFGDPKYLGEKALVQLGVNRTAKRLV